jgi:DNA-binding NtrC family response regulator
MVEGSEPASGTRLLILDADPARRDSLTGRFANLGFHVTPVCHPRQALEAASFRHFDYALLSAEWPGLETSTLISKLRWQLGDVKFVVYVVGGAGDALGQAATQDVLCVKVNPTHAHELAATLEHLVEDLIGRKPAKSGSRWELVDSM